MVSTQQTRSVSARNESACPYEREHGGRCVGGRRDGESECEGDREWRQEVPLVTTSASGSGTIGEDKSVGGTTTTTGVVVTVAHIHTGGAGKIGPATIGLTKSRDNV